MLDKKNYVNVFWKKRSKIDFFLWVGLLALSNIPLYFISVGDQEVEKLIKIIAFISMIIFLWWASIIYYKSEEKDN